jgi:hypothetical protein
MVKSFIFGKAVLYFRTPDAIDTFLMTQDQAPVTTIPVNRLHTVILDVKKNANWPLETVVKGITTALPANADEWDAELHAQAPDGAHNNRLIRYQARCSNGVMTNDWAEQVGRLLERFGVKDLIVRGDKKLQSALFPSEALVTTLITHERCVEEVTEVGRYPKRGQGMMARCMVLAKSAEAKPYAKNG